MAIQLHENLRADAFTVPDLFPGFSQISNEGFNSRFPACGNQVVYLKVMRIPTDELGTCMQPTETTLGNQRPTNASLGPLFQATSIKSS